MKRKLGHIGMNDNNMGNVPLLAHATPHHTAESDTPIASQCLRLVCLCVCASVSAHDRHLICGMWTTNLRCGIRSWFIFFILFIFRRVASAQKITFYILVIRLAHIYRSWWIATMQHVMVAAIVIWIYGIRVNLWYLMDGSDGIIADNYRPASAFRSAIAVGYFSEWEFTKISVNWGIFWISSWPNKVRLAFNGK